MIAPAPAKPAPPCMAPPPPCMAPPPPPQGGGMVMPIMNGTLPCPPPPPPGAKPAVQPVIVAITSTTPAS
jgi:hypothetical protein